MCNQELYQEARRYIAGGVNSPVRAFGAVGGIPKFISYAKGSKLYDVDGNSYIDYMCSWGACILGHSDDNIIKAIKKQAELGTSFGAPTASETEHCKTIIEAFGTSIELLRLVNSGTEACMSAIRLARGYTGKTKIIKFEGCYHGHADYLLVGAGSGCATFGIPDSLGVPEDFAKHTIVLPYNDLTTVKAVMETASVCEDVAAIIVEPVAANMGVVLPEEGFLAGLRELCDKYKVLLIFDEVITGFRLTYGGAQNLYNILPDLTCLGKIIGGGLPIGAYGGKKEIMMQLSPEGGVYQAGTLSGNPIAVNAGLSAIKQLKALLPEAYDRLQKLTDKLCQGLIENAQASGIPVQINHIGSMFTLFFTDKPVVDFRTAKQANKEAYSKYFHAMLKEGIYLPPSQLEANFLTISHTEEDIEHTLKASRQAFKQI